MLGVVLLWIGTIQASMYDLLVVGTGNAWMIGVATQLPMVEVVKLAAAQYWPTKRNRPVAANLAWSMVASASLMLVIDLSAWSSVAMVRSAILAEVIAPSAMSPVAMVPSAILAEVMMPSARSTVAMLPSWIFAELTAPSAIFWLLMIPSARSAVP